MQVTCQNAVFCTKTTAGLREKTIVFIVFCECGAWLSLVERQLWELNVAGSNPVAPTILQPPETPFNPYSIELNRCFVYALSGV